MRDDLELDNRGHQYTVVAILTSPLIRCPHQSSPELRVEPEVEYGVCAHRCLGHDGGDGKQDVRNLLLC